MEAIFQQEKNEDISPQRSKKPRLEQEATDTFKQDNPNQSFHFVALQDLPVLDAVLSIEKIQKQIFSQLSFLDLTVCRLVCHFWKLIATKEINERSSHKSLHFGYDKDAKQFTSYPLKQQQHLQNFTQLLGKTKDEFLAGTAFHFVGVNLAKKNQDLQDFLSSQGYRIKSLALEILYKSDSTVDSSNSFALFSLIQFVEKLLLEQTPNIHTLEIQFKTFVTKEIEEFYIHKEFNSELNLNLRIAKLGLITPQPLFECICRLAPKLERLDLPDEKLNFYYEPENRLHLLHQLKFFPTYESVEKDQIVTMANMEGNKLQLKHLSFNFDDIIDLPELWDKIAQVFNLLLKKNCDSLESLGWSRMSFLKGAQIPRMPKVKLINFADEFHDDEDQIDLFPKDLQMSKTFSSLHTIVINERCLEHFEYHANFLRDIGEGGVETVKYVNTFGGAINKKLFRKLFPNAQIN